MDKKPLMLVVKHTHKEWTNYMRKIALECGIPDSYRMILNFLLNHPGTNQKDLAKHCSNTTAAINRTIKEMHADGYITKETDGRDMRYTRLFLTERGKQRAECVRKKIREADSIITSVLTPEKEAEIIKLLDLISNTIKEEL